MRPQHARQAAESSGDDESDVFMQPYIVAENAHAQLTFADAHQALTERRANQDVKRKQSGREKCEGEIEKIDVVGEVDAELGSTAFHRNAVVAAGHRIPSVGKAPHALAER